VNSPPPFRRIELKIDVSGSLPLPGPHEIAATVWLPDPAKLGDKPLVMFASPGGGYSRGYFDLHFDGHSGYSQAEYHAARGIIYVAYDHLGVGNSSTKQKDAYTIEMLADANHAMTREILDQLAKGTLQSGFPAVKNPFSIGTGQSMGAGVTIIMQGRNRSFDAVGILGISAIHTQLPQRTFDEARQAIEPYQFTRATPPGELTAIPKTAVRVPDFVYPFHWEDEPRDILDADMKGGYPMRKSAPYFGSSTIPICAVAMNSPGFHTLEASMIKVPVFIGVGERDVCPNPWAEPSAYWRSKDVSLYVVPRMAHMHNFASTRELLWHRLDRWCRLVCNDAQSSEV
jgi:pimeloyl-ACP methyl ester carboxylesterase